MRSSGGLRRFHGAVALIALFLAGGWGGGTACPGPVQAGEPADPPARYWPAEVQTEEAAWKGRLVRVREHLAILTVRGSAEERGGAHGHLLREEVRRLVASVNRFLTPSADETGRQQFVACLAGARVMKEYLEPEVWGEVRACARAAGVDEEQLLLAQLFGDVNRVKGFSSFCSSFAAFGPATRDGKPVVGRNFDYAGHGLEGGVPLILQELPSGPNAGRPFVTIGYAGILNGWTALNADGLYASNNTLFGGVDLLEGLSTCFLLRKIVERGRTVEEGVAVVERGPRSCTTGMLIAGRNKAGAWDARLVEFDARKMAIVEPAEGLVLGTNSCQRLEVGAIPPAPNPSCSRFQALKQCLADQRGVLAFQDPSRNPTGQRDVYMEINLHSALLDLEAARFRLAVSPRAGIPAGSQPFLLFQIEKERVREVRGGE